MSVFGEIQLGNSRAVSDDEDDEFSMINEDETLKRKVYWLNEKYLDTKINADELILADGNNASAFVYTYLLSHFKEASDIEVLGLSATLSQYKVFKQNHFAVEKNCFEHFETSLRSNFIYLINNFNGKRLVVCQLYDQLKSNELYDWISQLTQKVDFTSTLMFCSQNKSHYLGMEQKTPFVRYLSSNKTEDIKNSQCTRLEEPNFIGDLPAALIHYCVSKKLEFTSFVCYTPSLIADSQAVKKLFDAAAMKLKETSPFINDDLSQKTLMSVGNIYSSVSALYM